MRPISSEVQNHSLLEGRKRGSTSFDAVSVVDTCCDGGTAYFFWFVQNIYDWRALLNLAAHSLWIHCVFSTTTPSFVAVRGSAREIGYRVIACSVFSRKVVCVRCISAELGTLQTLWVILPAVAY